MLVDAVELDQRLFALATQAQGVAQRDHRAGRIGEQPGGRRVVACGVGVVAKLLGEFGDMEEDARIVDAQLGRAQVQAIRLAVLTVGIGGIGLHNQIGRSAQAQHALLTEVDQGAGGAEWREQRLVEEVVDDPAIVPVREQRLRVGAELGAGDPDIAQQHVPAIGDLRLDLLELVLATQRLEQRRAGRDRDPELGLERRPLVRGQLGDELDVAAGPAHELGEAFFDVAVEGVEEFILAEQALGLGDIDEREFGESAAEFTQAFIKAGWLDQIAPGQATREEPGLRAVECDQEAVVEVESADLSIALDQQSSGTPLGSDRLDQFGQVDQTCHRRRSRTHRMPSVKGV